MLKIAYKSLVVLLVVVAVGAVYFAVVIRSLPNPELLENRQVAESTKIYDRTGKVLLYEIYGEEKRTVIPFVAIPDHVKKATIAIEDANFYDHPAFDIKSLFRAVLKNFSRGWGSQGGSTITQQLAKNAFLTREKTLNRKIKELALAFRLEKQYTKDEILNLYLNQIPYGSNAYGIEAASQTFFNKPAKELTLAEAALLTSLPQAPSYYSPYGQHLNELLDRKDLALAIMTQLGFITESEKTTAQKEVLQFAPPSTGIKAPHFVIAIQDYLRDRYGEDAIRVGGFKVITTLDWDLQQVAEKVVKEGGERNRDLYQGHNTALVAQDADTGQILALTGSRDYFADPEPDNCQPGVNCRFEGNFNTATQGLRQPGSAIKPLAYVTAFLVGYSPNTVLFDVPTEFAANDPACPLIVNWQVAVGEDCFRPQNFGGIFRGPIDLRNSLAQSVNITSVKVLYLAGIDNVLKTVKDFGINTLTERSRYGLSLVLGGGEVKLVELVNAYSVLAQEGKLHKQSMILEISDNQGRVLEEYRDDVQQVIEPQYPRLVNDILADVEARGRLFLPGSLALTVFPGRQIALKTGTTNDFRDAWAIGYSPSLVVGVWAGNNNNEPMRDQAGSVLAAVPIWSAFLSEALKDRPAETFTPPEPIVSTKPMFNSEYIVNYIAGGAKYPHVHELLYYLDQGSSQFDNWELPALKWAQEHIPDFTTNYNKQLPPGATLEVPLTAATGKPRLQIVSPLVGDFITKDLKVQFLATSSPALAKVEIYFNNQLLDTRSASSSEMVYSQSFTNLRPNPQNLLKIIAYDVLGNKEEQEIIVYANPL